MRGIVTVVCCVAVVGVGCGSGESIPANQGRSDEVVPDVAGVVSAAAIAACGGFTVETAAAFLDVPAGGIEDRSEHYSEELHLCSFSRTGSSDGVGFYLSVSESVERAVAEMQQGRAMAGFAQETIDEATGTESQGAPLESAAGIGEEAYFMEVNGTLNVRVGNVQIQVLPMENREQMREVGRIVAAGLTQP